MKIPWVNMPLASNFELGSDKEEQNEGESQQSHFGPYFESDLFLGT